jgi:Sulfotransferase family
MAMANFLNSESGVTCLHEGKLRHREESGDKLIPFLTLQNGQAYQNPTKALPLLVKYRASIKDVAASRSGVLFGDIAYNYAPFLEHIPTLFPSAKILVLFRNGRDFVQSATTLTLEDNSPVGWPPNNKKLTNIESFIGLGRWSPRKADPWAKDWLSEFDHFERNAWLWAETNRVILNAMNSIPPHLILTMKFEDFFKEPSTSYQAVRSFLKIPGPIPASTKFLLSQQPINQRTERAIGPVTTWTPGMRQRFWSIAGDVMERLSYTLD